MKTNFLTASNLDLTDGLSRMWEKISIERLRHVNWIVRRTYTAKPERKFFDVSALRYFLPLMQHYFFSFLKIIY